jgi:hypothetical protein
MKEKYIATSLFYFKIFMYIFAAIFAGYTVIDLDKIFLNKFSQVKYQFLIVFILTASFFNFRFRKWKENLFEIMTISILTTSMLQLLRSFKRNKQYVDNL